MTETFSAERVARRFIERVGMEHPTPEDLKRYLHDHPDADPSNHTVVQKDDSGGQKEEEGGAKKKEPVEPEPESEGKAEKKDESEGKKPSIKERLKKLPGKAKEFFEGAGASAKSFIEDPNFRRKAMQNAADGLAAAPEKVVKRVVGAIKHEAKEWKVAAGGIKAAMTGKEVSKEQKHAIKTVAIDLAITVAVAAISGGLASGASGLAQKSAASFANAVAKKIALNAVTEGMGNLVTLQELGHGAHGAVEMVGHFLKGASEDPKEDEVMAAWVTALVVKELRKGGQDDDVMEALEALGGDAAKEASMARRVAARFV